jgi:hypothetical protein
VTIDPNFHFYLEQLAVGDQKRTTPLVFNYLKHAVEKEKLENHKDIIEMIKEYQQLQEYQDAEESALLATVILHYLKNHVDVLRPIDYDYLKKIKAKCGDQFSEEQEEEFDLYLEAAKVSKFIEKHRPSQ